MFWTPAPAPRPDPGFAGVATKETFYELIKLDEVVKSRKVHFSSFRRKPESSIFRQLQNSWTPAFAGVTAFYEPIKLDELVKNRNSAEFVIPAKAGIQVFQEVMDPGACPGPDPGFAGVTTKEAFYDPIKLANGVEPSFLRDNLQWPPTNARPNRS